MLDVHDVYKFFGYSQSHFRNLPTEAQRNDAGLKGTIGATGTSEMKQSMMASILLLAQVIYPADPEWLVGQALNGDGGMQKRLHKLEDVVISATMSANKASREKAMGRAILVKGISQRALLGRG